MASQKSVVQALPKGYIPQAAALISSSFRGDSLIDFLRPGSPSWEENALAWQMRRVERFRLQGHVYWIPPTAVNPKRQTEPLTDRGSTGDARYLQEGNPGPCIAGLGMLYEPGETRSRSLLEWMAYLFFMIKDKLDPKPDAGLNPNRVKTFYDEHYRVRDMLCGKSPTWELEVVSVDQHFRGCGVGGQLIRHACSMAAARNQDIFLESTSAKNVPLYERYGFRTEYILKLPLDAHLTQGETSSSSSSTNQKCVEVFFMVRRSVQKEDVAALNGARNHQ